MSLRNLSLQTIPLKIARMFRMPHSVPPLALPYSLRVPSVWPARIIGLSVLIPTFGMADEPTASELLPSQATATSEQTNTATSEQTNTATLEQIKFFETAVRPVLATRCYRCHADEKQKGDLRLDSRAGLLNGGESGPAVVAAHPEDSVLIEAINYETYQMPPDGKLPDAEIAALTAWVEMGAPWPGAAAVAAKAAATKGTVTEADRAFWSYQPVNDPAPPAVADADWPRNSIDQFVLARLETAGLQPAPPADKATLARRAYFDLTGLPPTPSELDAFLADDHPQAYERLVDRLLDSPRYGERWARHWLDIVRYAESDGFKADDYRPQAWRYRDYVIRAFNDDKPYDQFVREQLAGDEMAPDDPDVVVATAFLRHGLYEYNQRDVETQWSEMLNDVTDVTGDVFLGMGVGCARCHDHKFDPILQRDYYRLQAFFTPMLPHDDRPLASAAQVAAYQEKLAVWEAATTELRAKIEAIETPARERAARSATDKFQPEIQEMLRKPLADRTPREHQLAELAGRQLTYEYERLENHLGKQKEQWQALKKELTAFDHLKPAPLPPAFAVGDVGPVAPPTTIPGGRNTEDQPPAFPTVLGGAIAEATPLPDSTGRRTALANWITRPEHPLTSRVLVNRLWQGHFGRGLVATASDFGRLGETPSHPELLDWLATRFVEGGWKLKPLHRLMMTSATYRQSATPPDTTAALLIDPENRLLWRHSPRRLAGEQIRDALLAVSGELDLHAGGPGVEAKQPRRTIYTRQMRNSPDPLLAVFDVPAGFGSTPERNVTTTAPQSLLMLNGSWTLGRARAFAKQLDNTPDEAERVRTAYRLAFGRDPDAAELAAATAFLHANTSDSALVDYAHVLLNANEFLYVE